MPGPDLHDAVYQAACRYASVLLPTSAAVLHLEGAHRAVVRVEPFGATYDDAQHLVRIANYLRTHGVPAAGVHGTARQLDLPNDETVWYTVWDPAADPQHSGWDTPGVGGLLAAVHRVPVPVTAATADGRHVARLLTMLDRIARGELATYAEFANLTALVDDALDALLDLTRVDATRVLTHGDFTTGNVLGSTADTLTLIDFEWSGAGPATLDLVKAVNRVTRFGTVGVDGFLSDYLAAGGPGDPVLAAGYTVIDDAVSVCFSVSHRRVSEWHADQADRRLRTLFHGEEHRWEPSTVNRSTLRVAT